MVAVGESIRVLVIEDEVSYRQGLASGLGREGFEAEVAPDGAEGLRLFTDHPPDTVLLDMLLPGTEADFGSVAVDFVRREVTVGDRRTHLSRREFDLLAVLLTPARRVRTRDELVDLLWPDRYLSDSRTLDTHIHRLRAKLEPDPADPQFIVTVGASGSGSIPTGHGSPRAPQRLVAAPDPRLSRSDR